MLDMHAAKMTQKLPNLRSSSEKSSGNLVSLLFHAFFRSSRLHLVSILFHALNFANPRICPWESSSFFMSSGTPEAFFTSFLNFSCFVRRYTIVNDMENVKMTFQVESVSVSFVGFHPAEHTMWTLWQSIGALQNSWLSIFHEIQKIHK